MRKVMPKTIFIMNKFYQGKKTYFILSLTLQNFNAHYYRIDVPKRRWFLFWDVFVSNCSITYLCINATKEPN